MSATSSRHTGTTVNCCASDRKPARSGCSVMPAGLSFPELTVEAALVPGVARAPSLLLDDQQDHVGVTVVVGMTHPLAVTRRLALAPVLLAAAAPEPGAPRREGAPERFFVHPSDHEDLFGALLLDDGGHQAVGV